MYDDLNENKSKKLALPIGMVKIPKFLYIIVIILSALILVVGGFNIYLIGNKNNKKTISNTKPITSQEIIKKELVWLNSQKDSRGVYYFGSKCNEAGVCGDPIVSNGSGLQVLWGLSKNYEKTKDSAVLKLIKDDIDIYSNKDKIVEIGSSSLTCGYLYNLWKENYLSQDYKDKIKQICQKVLYADSFPYEDLTNIKTETLKSEANSKLNNFIKTGTKVSSENNITGVLSLEPYYDFSRDYLAQSLITQDTLAEKKAYYLLNKLLDDYLSGSKLMKTNSQFCQFGNMILDFKLDNSNALAQKMLDLTSNNSEESIDCALLSNELSDKTEQNKFIDSKVKNNLENNYFMRHDNQGVKLIDVGYNGLMIGLLSQ